MDVEDAVALLKRTMLEKIIISRLSLTFQTFRLPNWHP